MKYHTTNNNEPCHCGCVKKRSQKKGARIYFLCDDCRSAEIKRNNKKGAPYIKAYRKSPRGRAVSNAYAHRVEFAKGGGAYADRILRSLGNYEGEPS